jgi:Undecaprenyl-phosphate glucose phosphotransferase
VLVALLQALCGGIFGELCGAGLWVTFMSNFSVTAVFRPATKFRSLFSYISYQRTGTFTATADFALILVASIVAGLGYNRIAFEFIGDIEPFVAVGSYCAVIFVLVSKLLDLYRPSALLSARDQLSGVLIAWSAALLFMLSVLFLFKVGANYSRGATVGFGTLGFVLLAASRTLIRASLRRALADGSLAGRRAVIIGDAQELSDESSLELLRTYGARELGRFELSGEADTPSDLSNDLAVVDSGINFARSQRAEQVLLAIRWADAARRDSICERLRALPLPVLLLPDRFVRSMSFEQGGELCGQAAIELQRAPLSRQDMIAKRCFDVLVASLSLGLLSFLFLTIAVAIKLDSPGPLIFRQRRKGFNGAEFGIYKFRTMTVLEDGPTIRQAQRNDDRVTWIGRLLRASSMDELPQLFNVLTGQMSLVGPRPHAIAHDEKYSQSNDNYALRRHVKPGITGWAQVHGFRGETKDPRLMVERVRCDLWYINNWSLLLDLQILARTCITVLRFQNAY